MWKNISIYKRYIYIEGGCDGREYLLINRSSGKHGKRSAEENRLKNHQRILVVANTLSLKAGFMFQSKSEYRIILSMDKGG